MNMWKIHEWMNVWGEEVISKWWICEKYLSGWIFEVNTWDLKRKLLTLGHCKVFWSMWWICEKYMSGWFEKEIADTSALQSVLQTSISTKCVKYKTESSFHVTSTTILTAFSAKFHGQNCMAKFHGQPTKNLGIMMSIYENWQSSNW